MKKEFRTKAETLESLKSSVKNASILPQIRFTLAQWNDDHNSILDHISDQNWFDIPVIVRSSAVSEDNSHESLAGRFLSVANVQGEHQIQNAISKVIDSFGTNPNESDQIFLQPMIKNTDISGVAFSRDPNTGGFYIVINYDESNSTSSITAGQSNSIKTYYYFKHGNIPPDNKLYRIIKLIYELENLFTTDSLDIEFAVTSDNELYLLQVRPLIFTTQSENSVEVQNTALNVIELKFREFNRPHPYLHGTRTVFGIMPDWNPAEIIGVRPRQLSLSLYKEIITDNIWAYQRDNYGYKNLRSFPLLINFCGLPYIDVRVSFNSFIPESIDDDLSERMVNYYIDRLLEHQFYHDKVEFDIVYSCYTLDLPARIQKLRNHEFRRSDCESLEESLRSLTNNIIHGETGLWRKDLDKIKTLENRHATIYDSDLDLISKIYWLIEDCKRYGTLPFAGLARAGFIAIQLLNSLLNVGILNQQEIDYFMSGLDTVGSQMAHDFACLSKSAFIQKYGHLRPGTYDILSPRYDEEPERYFNWSEIPTCGTDSNDKFKLTLEQIKQTERILKEHRLEHDVIGLFDFIKSAIEGREYSKFIFTRSLSDAMALLKKFTKEFGFNDDDCSYVDINCIRQLYASSVDIYKVLSNSINEGKERYKLTSKIILPPLITKVEDIWSFHVPETSPNFITSKTVSGPVTFASHDSIRLDKSILFIPSADPGYDWIFSHGIAGFITKFGGVNSHMAIRSVELGIPAVIGAGEILYNKWSNAKYIEFDSANKQVRILQ